MLDVIARKDEVTKNVNAFHKGTLAIANATIAVLAKTSKKMY